MTRSTPARLAALACAATLSLCACAGSAADRAAGPADRATTTAVTRPPSTTATPSPTARTTTPTAKPKAKVTAKATPRAARKATRTPTRSPARPRLPRETASPSPRVTPRPSPSTPAKTGVAGQVLALVNAERAKVGCRALSGNAALQRAAQAHSADMAARNYFSHTSQDGRTFGDRIRAAGYSGSTLGENIAAGQTTASAVMAAWMTSPGHKANILNCSFTALGVGHATGGSYGHYWTQDFGG